MEQASRGGAIRSDRRGFVEIDRARFDSVACECSALMQRRINLMYRQEFSAPRLSVAPFQESPVVPSSEAGGDWC
jgi:hypothetical protein